MNWASFEEFLTESKRFGSRNTPIVLILAYCLYFTSLIILLFGIDQLRKSMTSVTRHCLINHADVEESFYRASSRVLTSGPLWTPIWKVTILDEEDERAGNTEQLIKSLVGYGSKSWALKRAHKIKVSIFNLKNFLF